MYQEINGPSAAFTSIFNAIVAPRPIGWISSISADGLHNLAPFSYFNAISPAPPMVMFCCNGTVASGHLKDTIRNVKEVPEFVANFASYELREQMNLTSALAPYEVNEFELAGLASVPAKRVRPLLVERAPANLECTVLKIVELPPQGPGEVMGTLVIGKVVAAHVKDEYINAEGRFDSWKANPVVRLGGFNYATLGELFEMKRPD